MTRHFRCGWVLVLTINGSACGGLDTPTTPTSTAVSAAPASPTAPAPPAAPAGPARVFGDPQPLTHPLLGSWIRSSYFTLYDSGSFTLQSTQGPGGYRGTYADNAGAITFNWDGGAGPAGRWSATGLLDADRLTVRYNELMQLDDFEDAVYILRQQ